jgi:hypothetical protein
MFPEVSEEKRVVGMMPSRKDWVSVDSEALYVASPRFKPPPVG